MEFLQVCVLLYICVDLQDDSVRTDTLAPNSDATAHPYQSSSVPSTRSEVDDTNIRGSSPSTDGFGLENDNSIRHRSSHVLTPPSDSHHRDMEQDVGPIHTEAETYYANDGTSTPLQDGRGPLSAGNARSTDNINSSIVLKSKWGFKRPHSKWYQWIVGLIAALVYCWTVYYSYNATIDANPFLRLVQSSLNTRIFLIAFFSQITIIMITWLTHEVYNCIRWAWIGYPNGTNLTSFLVLNPTTSPVTLFKFLLFRIYSAIFVSERRILKRINQPVTLFVSLRYFPHAYMKFIQ